MVTFEEGARKGLGAETRSVNGVREWCLEPGSGSFRSREMAGTGGPNDVGTEVGLNNLVLVLAGWPCICTPTVQSLKTRSGRRT